MKYLLLLSTLTLTLSFSSATFAEWTLVSEGVIGGKHYVDIDRIKKNGGYLYFWGMRDYLEPDEDGDMSSKLSYQVDCKASRYKDLSYIFYRQPMGAGEGESYSPDKPEWHYPPPDSNTEALINFVCAQ